MELNDLLEQAGINPQSVIVLRHRPTEPELNRRLPWLAVERPDVFNRYQQTQGPRLESSMLKLAGTGYLASFIGHAPGKALFIGLYAIGNDNQRHNAEEILEWYKILEEYGWGGYRFKQSRVIFDLKGPTDFCSAWKGKLIVEWPPPERSWWRRAHRNTMPVHAILEDSALAEGMPAWRELVLSWTDLAVMPTRWREALSHWRGIYYIHDISDGKGYVGSAYGRDNLLGRWKTYSKTGHGNNQLLRRRNPNNLRFSILQRVSPDMAADDVIALENTWKERLHTRKPDGLNDN